MAGTAGCARDTVIAAACWGILFIAGGIGLLIFVATGLIVSGQKESATRGMAFTAIPILYRLRCETWPHTSGTP